MSNTPRCNATDVTRCVQTKAFTFSFLKHLGGNTFGFWNSTGLRLIIVFDHCSLSCNPIQKIIGYDTTNALACRPQALRTTRSLSKSTSRTPSFVTTFTKTCKYLLENRSLQRMMNQGYIRPCSQSVVGASVRLCTFQEASCPRRGRCSGCDVCREGRDSSICDSLARAIHQSQWALELVERTEHSHAPRMVRVPARPNNQPSTSSVVQ